MLRKRTSPDTAADPKSCIRQALRRWKCKGYRNNPPAFFIIDPKGGEVLSIVRGHPMQTFDKSFEVGRRYAKQLGRALVHVVHPYVPRGMRKGARVSPLFWSYGSNVIYPDGTMARGNPPKGSGDLATCYTCGLSWDDSIITSWTPAPAGRCPFEYHHKYDRKGEPIPLKPRDIEKSFPVKPIKRNPLNLREQEHLRKRVSGHAKLSRAYSEPWIRGYHRGASDEGEEVARMYGLPIQNPRGGSRAEKLLNKEIERAWYRLASGIQVDIMDIPKIFNDVKTEMALGVDLDTAIQNAIRKYRKNPNGRGEEIQRALSERAKSGRRSRVRRGRGSRGHVCDDYCRSFGCPVYLGRPTLPPGWKENPQLTRAAREFISDEISELMRKGYPQKRAIAAAYSMARRAGYKVPGRRNPSGGKHPCEQCGKDAVLYPYENTQVCARCFKVLSKKHGYPKPRGGWPKKNQGTSTPLLSTPSKLEAEKIAGWIGREGISSWVDPHRGAWGVMVPRSSSTRAKRALGKVLSKNPGVLDYFTKLPADIVGGIGFGVGAGIVERYIMSRGRRRNPAEGWVVTHDGETVGGPFKSDFDAVRWLHKKHSYSVDHAVRYEGYDIVLVKNGRAVRSYRRELPRVNSGKKSRCNPKTCRNPKHRHPKRNPLLQSVTLAAGNPPAKCPFRNGQRILVEKARAWVVQSGNKELLRQFDEALKLQTKANRKPEYVTWRTIPVGDPKRLEMVTAMAEYGHTDETVYKPIKGSKKGKSWYRHEWGEGKKNKQPVPVLAAPSGKAIIMPLGKGQVVNDWMRG